jgi:flavin reductase (DIM6/NTAB) family NADH-FMN oxidoreductase RutF
LKGALLQEVDGSVLYRLFNPQVPVVVCSKHREEVAAMPANSCVSISDSPSMVALAIRIGSRTNRVVSRSRSFSISWVNYTADKSRDIILKLSGGVPRKEEEPDKLKALGIPYALVRGIPVPSGAQAFALCEVERKERTGDHDLFVARSRLVRASRDFTRDQYWRFRSYRPALYLGSIRSKPMVTLPRQGPNR